jgi:kinetochore protein Mis12/MTW1
MIASCPSLTMCSLAVQNLSLPQTADANVPTPESIQILRRKLTASRTLTKALLREQQRYEAILQQLRSIAGSDGDHALGFLTTSEAARGLNVSSTSQALTNNTTFAMSQLPALKSLLAELRPRLASLKDTSPSYESAKDELRQERLEYIEQRTKAHLQRSGESLTDGASALPAQPLDADEIHALEKVAQSFNPP